jgi:hypothetical protein
MQNIPVGTFVSNKLAEGKKLVAKSRNSAGYAALIAQKSSPEMWSRNSWTSSNQHFRAV